MKARVFSTLCEYNESEEVSVRQVAVSQVILDEIEEVEEEYGPDAALKFAYRISHLIVFPKRARKNLDKLLSYEISPQPVKEFLNEPLFKLLIRISRDD